MCVTFYNVCISVMKLLSSQCEKNQFEQNLPSPDLYQQGTDYAACTGHRSGGHASTVPAPS